MQRSAVVVISIMSHLLALNCTGDDDSDSSFGDLPDLWVAGVACSVVSSFATAIGTIMQKKVHVRQESLPDNEKSPEFIGIIFNKRWFIALIVMGIVPLPFDFTAFALAPQSLIATMSGLTIVLNQVFAPIMLDEKLTRVEVYGTVIIVSGVVLVSLSTGSNPTDYNLCELIGRYGDPDVLGAVFFVIAMMIVCLFLIHSGYCPSMLEPVRPEFFAFTAGGFASLMQIAIKAMGELVTDLFDSADRSTWRTLWPYFHIVAIIFLAIGMISYINRGLQTYDAVLYTPLYFTNLIVLSSSLGLIFYKEYQDFDTWQMAIYPTGVVIVCTGILFMTLKGVNIQQVRARVARLDRSRAWRRSYRRNNVLATSNADLDDEDPPNNNNHGNNEVTNDESSMTASVVDPDEKCSGQDSPNSSRFVHVKKMASSAKAHVRQIPSKIHKPALPSMPNISRPTRLTLPNWSATPPWKWSTFSRTEPDSTNTTDVASPTDMHNLSFDRNSHPEQDIENGGNDFTSDSASREYRKSRTDSRLFDHSEVDSHKHFSENPKMRRDSYE